MPIRDENESYVSLVVLYEDIKCRVVGSCRALTFSRVCAVRRCGVYAASVIATIHVPIEFSEHVLDDDYFCVYFFLPRRQEDHLGAG